jgi:hypothetical protein
LRLVRPLQGYLWAPKALGFDPRGLPERLGDDPALYLALDRVEPPFAFFDDGTPTATQDFYQLTVLVKTERDPKTLGPLARQAATVLEPRLHALPEGVGWMIFEDLREV